MEEAEWLYNRVFDGESVDFHNIAKQMNGLFGIDREPRSIGSFARQFLQWRAPKLSPSAWANSSDQILWIVRKASKGMLWKDMANLFNKKFNSNRTGEELRARYEEVRRALDPKTPDAERPDWAKIKNETFATIQASVRGRRIGPKWKKEEDQLLDECRNRNMSWEQIAEELQRKFGIIRTPGALHGRFKAHHRDQPGYKSTLKHKAWTQDEIDWLISEEKKRKKERTTMAHIAARFEKYFGYPQNRKNIESKVEWLRVKKLV